MGRFEEKAKREGAVAESDLLQYEYSLVRYMPNLLKQEFVNIGVVLREAEAPEHILLRFTQDWTRARCLDPQIDVTHLEKIEDEVRTGLARQLISLEELREGWSNSLRITAGQVFKGETFMTEMDRLMQSLVDRPKPTKGAVRRGRTAVFSKMRRQFEQEGVWDFLIKKIAIAKYTRAGDPLQIDCGYRTNGTMKMFQAVSLETDVDAAVKLAFVAARLRERVKEVENATLELTAITEPISEIEQDEDSRALYSFGYDTMMEHQIRVMSTLDLPRMAATVQRDLRI